MNSARILFMCLAKMLIMLMQSASPNECQEIFRIKVPKKSGYNSQVGTYCVIRPDQNQN